MLGQRKIVAARCGFTLTELLIVICLIVVLAGLIIPVLPTNCRGGRRTACKSNLFQIGKACVLYADVGTDLGQFPRHSSGDPMLSLNLLYDEYIQDVRLFSCPSKQVSVKGIARMSKVATPDMTPSQCSYGYDPSHTDTHGIAGIAADVAGGVADGTMASNSMNHGGDGQNILIGGGSVEWLDISTRDVNGHPDVIWKVDELPIKPEEDSHITQDGV